MIDSVMFWNEPNNKSHWDFELDPEWNIFAEMVKAGARAVAKVNPALIRVLGGISPIDASFIQRLEKRGVLETLNAVAVHGFPLDWNHWKLNDWPQKLDEIHAATSLPCGLARWASPRLERRKCRSSGCSARRSCSAGRAPRIHWYSLYDLPKDWPATTRHREAEGSSYYRHFYMGLLKEDGTPKLALKHFSRYTPDLGICQWFHYLDPRLEPAVKWLKELGVRHLRTGLSWADSFRPDADAWFDRQMEALADFDVTITYCFTPEHLGLAPHHTSPPKHVEEYAEFCARMTARYAPPARVNQGVPAILA